MDLQPVGTTAVTPLPALPPPVISKIALAAFEEHFYNADDVERLATDEHTDSSEKSITAFDVGDCITVFGIVTDAAGKKSVMGYHIDRFSDQEEINDILAGYLTGESNEIYLIGGQPDSSKEFVEKIHAALDSLDNREDIKILGEFINVKEDFTYISANLQLNGILVYCQHNLPI